MNGERTKSKFWFQPDVHIQCVGHTPHKAALPGGKWTVSQCVTTAKPKEQMPFSSPISDVSWPRLQPMRHIEGCSCKSPALEGTLFKMLHKGTFPACSDSVSGELPSTGGERLRKHWEGASLKKSVFLNYSIEPRTPNSQRSRSLCG